MSAAAKYLGNSELGSLPSTFTLFSSWAYLKMFLTSFIWEPVPARSSLRLGMAAAAFTKALQRSVTPYLASQERRQKSTLAFSQPNSCLIFAASASQAALLKSPRSIPHGKL